MNSNNTAIIALSSFAGMGPYVASIVNAFKVTDPIWFVLVEDERHYFTKNISGELKKKCLIIYRPNTKLNKLKSIVFSDKDLIRQITDLIVDKHIGNIHMLASCFSLRNVIFSWRNKYRLIMTIHDLHPHEAKKAFYKIWRQRRMYMILDKMRDACHDFITNSQAQFKELKSMYPSKDVFYHEFPSLLTESISSGKKKVPELQGISNYVLFFGRIEAYKGLDVLYKAWCECPDLNQRAHLVIAGSGNIYFPRSENEKNVVFINRYIHDEEIATLYNHAVCTVYPYISASQSGVLSLSCFFKSPIIASDVPFFHSIEDNGIGYIFDNGNSQQLAERILSSLNMSDEERNKMQKTQSEYYDKHYDTKAIRKALLEYYNK